MVRRPAGLPCIAAVLREPPIDHRYTVNERRRPCSRVTKIANVLRENRLGGAAHNGLVAGSSPAGPTSELRRHFLKSSKTTSPASGPASTQRLSTPTKQLS